jgi:signal peptidase I
MKKSLLRHAFVFLALGTFLFPLFWFRPIQISGDSMSPTFSDGEWVWTIPLLGNPEAGDCVVFESPVSRQSTVKRVIALPGETFLSRHEVVGRDTAPLSIHKGIWVNASLSPETALHPPLPAGYFFLLGDNPEASVDSRGYGPVAREWISRRVIGDTSFSLSD